MSESELDAASACSQGNTIQEGDAKRGSKPQDTLSALLDLARLIATIHTSDLIAANDNRPRPSDRGGHDQIRNHEFFRMTNGTSTRRVVG